MITQNIVTGKYTRRYELTDHLGNVRAVIGDARTYTNSTTISPVIHSLNNYYAFGSPQPGRVFNMGNYRYGFNGQEKEDEIKGTGNAINYKFRMHDPRIGRFFAVDPLAKKYPFNSPYAFSENRVIDCFELEGLESSDAVGKPAILEKDGYKTAQSSTYMPKTVPQILGTNNYNVSVPQRLTTTISQFDPVQNYKNFLSTTSPGTVDVASNPLVQSSIQTAIGIKAVGIVANATSVTKSLIFSKTIVGGSSAAFELYNQSVSNQDISLPSYDIANAGFKGMKSALLFGSSSNSLFNTKILGRSVSDFGSDLLSSTIDLMFNSELKLNLDTKFDTRGLVEFGYRTGLGYGTDRLIIKGYNSTGLDISSKYVRRELYTRTLKLLNED